MKPTFKKTKVKSWIKKAYKNQSLGYGHGFITDGYILLIEEQHMRPVILELFGTLTPECRYTAEMFQKTMILPDETIEMIDSELEYAPDPKYRLRIFYDPATGRELAIDGKYFDLLDNPRAHTFYTNDAMDRLWIVYDSDVIGLFAPVRLQNQLSHVRFKAEEKAEQV